MSTKICPKCKTEKELSQFHNDKARRDGKTACCGKCRYETAKKWAKLNPDKVRGYDLKRRPPKPRPAKIIKFKKSRTKRKGVTIQDRFEMQVMPALDGCHYWIGHATDSGYGHFTINYKNIRAHRMSYMLYKGEITDGLVVCHTCDNTLCVNPDHLFLGTNKDNYLDMVKKGRRWITKVGEEAGASKLTEDQVKEILSLKGVLSQSKIAKKFSVSQSNIWFIHNGKSWKNIQTSGEKSERSDYHRKHG